MLENSLTRSFQGKYYFYKQNLPTFLSQYSFVQSIVDSFPISVEAKISILSDVRNQPENTEASSYDFSWLLEWQHHFDFQVISYENLFEKATFTFVDGFLFLFFFSKEYESLPETLSLKNNSNFSRIMFSLKNFFSDFRKTVLYNILLKYRTTDPSKVFRCLCTSEEETLCFYKLIVENGFSLIYLFFLAIDNASKTEDVFFPSIENLNNDLISSLAPEFVKLNNSSVYIKEVLESLYKEQNELNFLIKSNLDNVKKTIQLSMDAYLSNIVQSSQQLVKYTNGLLQVSEETEKVGLDALDAVTTLSQILGSFKDEMNKMDANFLKVVNLTTAITQNLKFEESTGLTKLDQISNIANNISGAISNFMEKKFIIEEKKKIEEIEEV